MEPQEAASLLDDPDIRVRGDAFAALVSHAGDVSGILAECLGSDSANTRACAVLALANRGEAGMAGRVARLESDPSAAVRECVAGAIGHLGARGMLGVLGRLLRDPDTGVRKGAARALLRMGEGADVSGVPGGDAELEDMLGEIGRSGQARDGRNGL